MKKVAAIFLVTLLFVPAAFAQFPSNMAIGYDNGLSMRFITEGGVGLQGIVGLDMDASNPGNMTDAKTRVDFNAQVNVFKSLLMTEGDTFPSMACLNGYAGVGVNVDGSRIKDSDNVTDFFVEVGLSPEIFLLDNLSVVTNFGVELLMAGDTIGDDGKAAKDTGGMDIFTFGQGISIVEGWAFNWYF